jgi:hypothetical protein
MRGESTTAILIELIGIDAARKMVKAFGGQVIYIPKRVEDIENRNKNIRHKYKCMIKSKCGKMNIYRELARQNNITTRSIMIIINDVLKPFDIQLSKKIKNILRSRIWDALLYNKKCAHTEELVGCSIPFLKAYFEKKFKPGMTWRNHGNHGWHIDHIRPCASFDLSKPEEQFKCFHYTNLQPLWKEENLKKHDKYDGPLN